MITAGEQLHLLWSQNISTKHVKQREGYTRKEQMGLTGAWAIIKASGHQYRWLVVGYDLEIGHF